MRLIWKYGKVCLNIKHLTAIGIQWCMYIAYGEKKRPKKGGCGKLAQLVRAWGW